MPARNHGGQRAAQRDVYRSGGRQAQAQQQQALDECADAGTTTTMAKNTRRVKTPRWLKHRNLIAAEALALAGVGKYALALFVKDQHQLPNWSKVLFLVATTIGILGVLYLTFERVLTRGVERTHEVVKVLPLPFPVALFHCAAWVGIFYLYAWVYHLPSWPMVP
jgi:hypothetical protein